ncbi:uncharacterized protein LOC100836892 [Brachypodium distachyon]|uniref:Uncharacterized protein n=1 Tax=Brachypodium distachyon TaxID=15368 RepID=A0A0Q3HGJ8_BRADI|nr:uncharacterized protein LOC100836892 [Brachypodium distachyon]KQJ87555.1 hypothetical protein BRADI_4g11892v3 [Brachypodium distachyon]|eukprot:XP_010237493.1 uncharacterized protein LOC100836892 [Brachypodium distachyon]
MEKGAAGGDPARAAVGVCEKLLTFFSKNLSMTRQKAITDGPRTGAGSDNRDKDRSKEDEEDEFMVKIERAEFEFREEEEEQKKSFTTATILGGPSTDLRSSAGASDLQQQPKEAPLKAAQEVAAVAAAGQGEKKVKKTVTIKEEASETKGVKKAASVVKKRERQASSSSAAGDQQQQGEEGKAPAQRWGLRPRMASGLRVASNINQKSTDFIEQRRRGFGAGGKSSRRNDES